MRNNTVFRSCGWAWGCTAIFYFIGSLLAFRLFNKNSVIMAAGITCVLLPFTAYLRKRASTISMFRFRLNLIGAATGALGACFTGCIQACFTHSWFAMSFVAYALGAAWSIYRNTSLLVRIGMDPMAFFNVGTTEFMLTAGIMSLAAFSLS